MAIAPPGVAFRFWVLVVGGWTGVATSVWDTRLIAGLYSPFE